MAQKGNSYTIQLKQTHLNWGVLRYTSSRGIVYGEGYIPIPAVYARQYNLYNSNYRTTGLGYNQFNASSSDDLFNGRLKTSGCKEAGDIYAKNLHGSGNLKALGSWFSQINAAAGDFIEVRWTSPTDIMLTHTPNTNN